MNIDEKERILVRGEQEDNLNRSFFVSAGAGAGKTSILVDRIVNLLKNQVNPSEIVVITFTNAAAAELRERISNKVRESKLKGIKVDEMTISTIHAFCNKLLNMRSLDMDMGLSRELMENDEALQLKKEFFKEYTSNNLYNPEISDMMDWYDWKYKEILADLFVTLADRRLDKVNYWEDAGLKKLSCQTLSDFEQQALIMADTIWKQIASSKKALDNLVINQNGVKEYDALSKDGKILFDSLEEIINNKDQKAALKQVINIKSDKNIFSESGKGVTKDVKPNIQNENDNFKAVVNARGNFLVEYEAVKASYGMRAVLPMVSDYQSRKDNNKISNDELLYLTMELTKKPEAVRFFQEKYKYLIVDEYQDTDDLQNAIIWNLIRDYDKEDFVPADMLDEGKIIRPGSLVVVGDEKQSIYRFRGADASLFGQMRERLKETNKVSDEDAAGAVELSVNFRSNGEIIDWVNKTYKPRFEDLGEVYSEMNVSEERKNFTSQPEEKDALKGVFHCGSDTPEVVAALIKNLVNSGKKIVVKDRNTGNYITKGIDYSDIMVLTRNTKKLPLYANVLRKNDIPVDAIGNLDEYKSRSDKDDTIEMINTIKNSIEGFGKFANYLASPYDKRRLVELIQFVAGKDFLMITTDEEKEWTDKLKAIRRYLRGMTAIEVAGYFQKHIELIMPHNGEVSDHIYLEIQRQYDGLYEYIVSKNVRVIDDLREETTHYLSLKKERLAFLAEDRNAVLLMNRHKAKGLQAPIVIIAQRGYELNKENINEYKEGNTYYPVVVEKISENRIKNNHTFINDKAILDKAKRADYLDAIRMSYVESTRAQEVLIFTTPDSRAKSSCILEAVVNEMEDINKILTDAANKHGETQDGDEKPVSKYTEASDELLEGGAGNIAVGTYITINPSGMEHRDGDRTYTAETRPRGNIFGTVMHRCFELLVKRYESIKSMSEEERRDVVFAIVTQAIMESYVDIISADNSVKEYETYLRAKMIEFLNSSLFNDEICNAKKVYPEYEFSFTFVGDEARKLVNSLRVMKKKYMDYLDYDYNNGGLWVNGIADLVIERKDGSILIVDYKSDSLICYRDENKKWKPMTAEQFKEVLYKRYVGQLELYKAAITHLFKKNNIKQVEYMLYGMYENHKGWE